MADRPDKPSPPHPGPHQGPAAQSEAAQRRHRQAAALRENLRRRKARERGRDDAPAKPEGGSGTPL